MVILCSIIAPPPPPTKIKKAKTIPRSNKYYTIHSHMNNVFGVKIKDETPSLMVGFKNYEDAFLMARMLETYYNYNENLPVPCKVNEFVLPSSEESVPELNKLTILHNDTDNLRRNIHKINPNDIISIHYKKHGTSVVIGNVLVKKALKWYEILAKKLGFNIVNTEYDIIYSSRKVIKNGYLNTTSNSFYKTDIWGDVKDEIKDKIPKNYTLYGEILGYEKSGSPIQGNYDYGCLPNGVTGINSGYENIPQHKFYVYRITVVNIDGQIIELTDKQIEEFCEKYGLLYKNTFIYYGKAKDLYSNLDTENHWHEGFLANLEKELDQLYNFYHEDRYRCSPIIRNLVKQNRKFY